MQDDITDGVKYIIKQGLANKNKICIFGAGSRGYAALAGLTFTPDLYACGISLNEMGYLNLFNLMAPELHSSERYDYLGLLYKVIGHPEKDKQLLKKTSPFYHAKNIKRPLLIAHGALNSMVKKPEVDTFVRRLQKNGLNPVYMVKYKEGSRWSSVDRKENLMEFYSVLEEFLAQHLASK